MSSVYNSDMAGTNVVTARVDSDTLDGLERLARYYDRSKAWLVAKAISQYVKDESVFFAFLKEGEDSIDRGDFLTQEQMVAWVRSLERQDDAA